MIRSTFALPLLIALASLAGLIVALLGDGWTDAIAALCLTIPVIAWVSAMQIKRT